jgi:hypothetical protein
MLNDLFIQEKHINTEQHPVAWCSNKRLCIATATIKELLATLNQKMKREIMKILLIVDNLSFITGHINGRFNCKMFPSNMICEE